MRVVFLFIELICTVVARTHFFVMNVCFKVTMLILYYCILAFFSLIINFYVYRTTNLCTFNKENLFSNMTTCSLQPV